MTLCGITIRFQMLFPSERQVTHALLTRPPLIHSSVDRSLRRNFIVRLACVKHAASVRPEPGSNSLKIISKHPLVFKPFLELNRSFRHLLTIIFKSFRFRNLCKVHFAFAKLRNLFRVLFSSLFNFQGANRRSEALAPETASLLYQTPPPLSTLFLKFFYYFFNLVQRFRVFRYYVRFYPFSTQKFIFR